MSATLRRAAIPRPALRIIGGLFALIAVGTGLLLLPWSGANRRLTLSEAAFTAVSALTTTGLSVIQPSRDLSIFGQVVLMLLMQFGAVGFVVLAVAIFRLLGQRISFAERVALRDSLGVVELGAIVRLTERVLLGVLVIEAIGALLLWIGWAGTYGLGRGLYLAIFHSISAFSNSSFDLFGGGGQTATNPFPADTYTLTIIGSLIALGSIGIPVIADVLNWRSHPRFTLHTRLTITIWLVLTIMGTALVFLSESVREGAFSDLSVARRFEMSLFHVVASRTSGFNVYPIDALTPASVLVLTVLMFIGGSPASTAGGITTGSFAVLTLAALAYIRSTTTVRIGNRSVSPLSVQKATAVLLVSIGVVAVGAWLLMLTQPVIFQDALFEAVSAFATCGFSLGLTGDLDPFGRFVVALLMIWGRLGPLTIVLAVARSNRPSPIRYPEERILVG